MPGGGAGALPVNWEAEWTIMRAERDALKVEVERLHEEIEFWMGEGDGTTGPEDVEWRKLASIPNGKRTAKQTDRLGELAKLVRYYADEKLQRVRAEVAEAEVKRLQGVAKTETVETD